MFAYLGRAMHGGSAPIDLSPLCLSAYADTPIALARFSAYTGGTAEETSLALIRHAKDALRLSSLQIFINCYVNDCDLDLLDACRLF